MSDRPAAGEIFREKSSSAEAVYLHELADGRAARRVIGQWMAFYNEQRPHSALGGRTPAQYYDGARAASEQAA